MAVDDRLVAVRAEFGLLGPLYVRSEGVTLPVAAPGQRVVLAALAVRAGRVVSFEELSAGIWGDAPPSAARVAVRNQVSRLRHRLGRVGGQVVTRDPGYVLDAAEDDVDLLDFARLCREGGAAVRAGAWQRASDLLYYALRLWRGMPLADVPSPVLRDEHVAVVDALRLQAIEWRLEAGLHTGRHNELVVELEGLVREHPLRERFHAQLMLALYRCGRQGDALGVYRSARDALVTELGVEPGQDLRELHERILAADPLLLSDVPAATPGLTRATLTGAVTVQGPDGVPCQRLGGGAATRALADRPARGGRGPVSQDGSPFVADRIRAFDVVPRQAPAPVSHFTGRTIELAALDAVLDAALPGGLAVAVAAIDGPPGVGKTALAVRWAHQAAAEFPDGQLYVNLRGFGSPDEIMPPGTAIRRFLDALGIPAERIAPDPESQAALYRSVLAGKRVLIVADNARDAGQIRPLLPGSPGCMVLVTSRNRLIGLAAAEGAQLITLDVLPDGEARELLTRRIGGTRAAADPDAVSELARLCGGLPLALGVAAARATARPTMPLAAVAAELAGAESRLEALQTGDPVTDVRTVFSWSCQHLDPDSARLFRLLGVHPGPDITASAAAALLGIRQDGARSALDALAMASLAAEHIPGRYCLHDLLRSYAEEQATRSEPAAERRAAVQRMLDYYLYTSHAAALLLNPHRVSVPVLPPPSPGVAPDRFDGHQQALAWFQAEHQVLLGCVSLAAETGSDACAWILPWAITEFLDRRGYWHEWAATQRTALAAATRLGDLAGQAAASRAIATACVRLTDYRQARGHLAACLRLHRQLGDRAGEALARHSLGRVAEHQGRYADALRHEQQALSLFQCAGDLDGQALALNAIGWYHNLLGNPQQARAFCQQALTLYRRTGSRVGQAQAWDSLGYAEHHLGRLDHATTCYQHALSILCDLGELFGQADTLTRLGDTRAATHDLHAAQDAWQQALDILQDLHHPHAAQVRAKLGR
jgi:DNA-binding SARP family transcriptional activator/tetratricopeptide (TPR) repeat protein